VSPEHYLPRMGTLTYAEIRTPRIRGAGPPRAAWAGVWRTHAEGSGLYFRLAPDGPPGGDVVRQGGWVHGEPLWGGGGGGGRGVGGRTCGGRGTREAPVAAHCGTEGPSEKRASVLRAVSRADRLLARPDSGGVHVRLLSELSGMLRCDTRSTYQLVHPDHRPRYCVGVTRRTRGGARTRDPIHC
jgi:hypothetical protein